MTPHSLPVLQKTFLSFLVLSCKHLRYTQNSTTAHTLKGSRWTAILLQCCVNTWADAEVDVIPPHAGGRVRDCRHVREKLHGAQRVLRSAAIHHTVVMQVTLNTENRRGFFFFKETNTNEF